MSLIMYDLKKQLDVKPIIVFTIHTQSFQKILKAQTVNFCLHHLKSIKYTSTCTRYIKFIIISSQQPCTEDQMCIRNGAYFIVTAL